LSTVRQNYC